MAPENSVRVTQFALTILERRVVRVNELHVQLVPARPVVLCLLERLADRPSFTSCKSLGIPLKDR